MGQKCGFHKKRVWREEDSPGRVTTRHAGVGGVFRGYDYVSEVCYGFISRACFAPKYVEECLST